VRLLNHTAHRGEHQGSKKTPPRRARRSGLPMPRRRTLATGILPSARSMLPALRHPWLRWSATPAPGARATPRCPRVVKAEGR